MNVFKAGRFYHITEFIREEDLESTARLFDALGKQDPLRDFWTPKISGHKLTRAQKNEIVLGGRV